MSRQPIENLCIFGSYDDSELYSRNTALVRALSACATQVVTVRPRRARSGINNHQRVASPLGRLKSLVGLVIDAFSLIKQRDRLQGADCYFVPYPAYLDLLLLRALLPRQHRSKIIVDAFLCLQDTLVNDRQMLKAGGVFSRAAQWLERVTLEKANLVFIDTPEQREQLCQQYQLQAESVVAIPVGIDETVWTPLPTLPLVGEFRVFFWGTFIPLHGIDTIIRAAHILQQSHPYIQFSLVGDGQTAKDCERLASELALRNLDWMRAVLPIKVLRDRLKKAHCVLGIFGASVKAANVVPYKVYQALAADKIVVSRDGPALRALVGPEGAPGVFLVPPADPDALAAAIASVYEGYAEQYQRASTRSLFDLNLSNSVLMEKVSFQVARL